MVIKARVDRGSRGGKVFEVFEEKARSQKVMNNNFFLWALLANRIFFDGANIFRSNIPWIFVN